MAPLLRQPRIALDRIIAGFLLALAFLVMASVFVPGSIHADNSTPRLLQPPTAEQPAPEPSIAETASDVSLGSIESARYTAYLIGADDGTRYTIFDNRDGTLIGERLTADVVRQLFPDLLIDEKVTDPADLLMTAEQVD